MTSPVASLAGTGVGTLLGLVHPHLYTGTHTPLPVVRLGWCGLSSDTMIICIGLVQTWFCLVPAFSHTVRPKLFLWPGTVQFTAESSILSLGSGGAVTVRFGGVAIEPAVLTAGNTANL